MGSAYLMSTGFPFGVMKILWNQRAVIVVVCFKSCVFYQFKKKILKEQNNPLGVETRQVLKIIYYLLLVLKNLEKSVILKELRLWTSEVSINTENMFSPEKALSFHVLLDPYRHLRKNTVWAKVRSIYIDFL